MDRFGTNGYGWLVFLVVMVCAAGIGGMLGYRALFTQDQINQNKTALTALCAQRHDLDLRIASTNRVLRRHRKEKRIFGIPRSLIIAGRDRDENTRRNLEILDCKEQP